MAGPLEWGVDAASDTSIATLNSQGATFLCTYLAPYPSESWKIRTPAEWQAYIAAGIQVVANWESDGTPGSGFSTGVDAANQSQSLLNDRGCPGAPVYFTFADSASPNLGTVRAAIDGAVSVLGWDRVGAYGGINTIKYLADGNACHYYWQTYAWSNGNWDPRAQLRQWKNTSTLDFDTSWAPDFGQYPRPAGVAPAAPAAPAALTVVGDILLAYNRLGGAPALGAPTMNEAPCRDGVGRWQQFAGGTLGGGQPRIYWHPTATGGSGQAWVITGAINDEYKVYDPNGDDETGWLGYPLGEEYGAGTAPNDGRVQEFQHGTMFYSGTTKVAAALGTGLAMYWHNNLTANPTTMPWPSATEGKESFATAPLEDKSFLFWRYATNMPYRAK
jgi:hypothetical protein